MLELRRVKETAQMENLTNVYTLESSHAPHVLPNFFFTHENNFLTGYLRGDLVVQNVQETFS